MTVPAPSKLPLWRTTGKFLVHTAQACPVLVSACGQ